MNYRSVGPTSDAFVRVLDEVYGTKTKPKAMARDTTFAAISLGGDPRDLAKGPVQMKLFYEATDQDSYAELFTNIDSRLRRVEIREKDEEYRSPIVRALS